MRRYLARKLINWLVKDLYNGVTIDEVLWADKGRYYIGWHQVTPDEMAKYQIEAVMITDAPLWKTLTKNLKYLANKRMYEQSKAYEDMYFGKAMLYVIDVMEKTMISLRPDKERVETTPDIARH